VALGPVERQVVFRGHDDPALAVGPEANLDRVHDFAEAEVAPHAEEWDREHRFPVATVLAMGAEEGLREAVGQIDAILDEDKVVSR